MAEHGANVVLDEVAVTDSGETGNGDGIALGDSSVVERDVFGEVRVTANSAVGVRCEPAPAVPQLVLVGSSSVFGNAGGDIVCPGY